jgi:hypothetical protein
MWQVNKVVTAVHAFEQVDGITDVVGADLSLNDLSVGADVG